MNSFLNWFADSPIASYLRVLLAVVISNAIAEFSKVGYFDFTNWQTWLISALVAGLPTLMRLLNRSDSLSL